jgi:hypothetical protein
MSNVYNNTQPLSAQQAAVTAATFAPGSCCCYHRAITASRRDDTPWTRAVSYARSHRSHALREDFLTSKNAADLPAHGKLCGEDARFAAEQLAADAASCVAKHVTECFSSCDRALLRRQLSYSWEAGVIDALQRSRAGQQEPQSKVMRLPTRMGEDDERPTLKRMRVTNELTKEAEPRALDPAALPVRGSLLLQRENSATLRSQAASPLRQPSLIQRTAFTCRSDNTTKEANATRDVAVASPVPPPPPTRQEPRSREIAKTSR